MQANNNTRIIDLSTDLDNNKSWAPWWARTKVKHQGHVLGKWIIRFLFGVKSSFLKTGLGWAHDEISLSTHGTTHLDAPWHYAPYSEGEVARTIDQIPLHWCYANAVKLDMRHKQDQDPVSIRDLQEELQRIDYTIQPCDIVLICTGDDRMLGSRDYFHKGMGVSAEATKWILDHGVKITGIDSWGWDQGLQTMAERAKQSRRGDLFWEAHFVGVEKEYCHLERLTNLDKLPAKNFRVCCFPLKVKNASAGPARVVAILE